ncbi:hypothetical protein MYMA111404_02590 [Mycoplasma marinum]|uniref:Glycoside hydrolase family 38 N-terminal domain-containing protein n=1 Tax=Mycoplasma marinum TaxID=1937190 RepID=A0A4R0XV04_9MOLU|nr:hypothetical protein [Mycoplasma marinum]TCG11539.1 hypothetical protein C4B24_01680 [Mycoplasma marinum]
MEKRKIYLVPHTHWDREWMFSEQTGNVLLNQMINELILIIGEQKDFKMVLDGQASLVDDYLKWNKDKKEKVVEVLKKSQVALGPWYSQPDVFSSLGETTIRNIEVGKKTISDLGIKPMNTAYMPDTFGFNQNLPQIFVKNGLRNFVHWRGLNRKQIKDYPLYRWRGIDGTEVMASNYKKGYYHLGMYYPYRGLTNENINELADKFITKTKDTMNEWFDAQKIGNSILFPLGGDQAPAEHEAKRFFELINSKQNDFEWVLTSDFNEFFDEYRQDEKVIIHKGDLKTPIAGRIHRTISSARYDIKSLFRRCETNLYYKLEPLEIMYKNIDGSYNFEEYKLNTIIKPLLKLQAHDSLGGCNTDITNEDILSKLKQVDRRITSLIDLITYKLMQNEGLRDTRNAINIINQAPFVKSHSKIMVIYSNLDAINVENTGLSIHTISSKNIGFTKGIFELKVLITTKEVEKFSYSISEINKMNEYKPLIIKTNLIMIQGENIIIGDENRKEFKLNLTQDCGDNYDYSPTNEEIKFKQTHELVSQELIGETNVAVINTKIVSEKDSNEFLMTITTFNGKHDIEIETVNKLIGYRVSILFKGPNKISKSQHLVISKFNELDERDGWREDMHEFPAMIDHNDGLIRMDGEGAYNIYTRGNNEFFKRETGIELILYRTQEFVSRANLKWRPNAASGISYAENSDSSKLLKKLIFKIRLDEAEAIEGLNDWNFRPIIHFKNKVHLTAHVHNKFEINDIIWNSKEQLYFPIVDNKKLYISSIKLSRKGGVDMRLSNMLGEEVTTRVSNNGIEKEVVFKPYEYKNIKAVI